MQTHNLRMAPKAHLFAHEVHENVRTTEFQSDWLPKCSAQDSKRNDKISGLFDLGSCETLHYILILVIHMSQTNALNNTALV